MYRRLKTGESRIFVGGDDTLRKEIKAYGRCTGRRFKFRQAKQGLRVWRLKDGPKPQTPLSRLRVGESRYCDTHEAMAELYRITEMNDDAIVHKWTRKGLRVTRVKKPTKYPFAMMKTGERVFTPCNERDAKALIQYSRRYSKASGKRFEVETVPGGIRILRLNDNGSRSGIDTNLPKWAKNREQAIRMTMKLRRMELGGSVFIDDPDMTANGFYRRAMQMSEDGQYTFVGVIDPPGFTLYRLG